MTIALDRRSDRSLARRNRLAAWTPRLVLLPTLLASVLYVLIFTLWTLWISVSNSTLLPDLSYSGFRHYLALWNHQRWSIAYTNLFVFGSLYVLGSLLLGTFLAILIDQRVRGESVWRAIFLYPLAISFVVTGTAWRWILDPSTGIEMMLKNLGWENAT